MENLSSKEVLPLAPASSFRLPKKNAQNKRLLFQPLQELPENNDDHSTPIGGLPQNTSQPFTQNFLLRSFCFEATHRPGLPFQDLMTAHTIHQGLPIDLRITGVFGANKKDKLDAPPT